VYQARVGVHKAVSTRHKRVLTVHRAIRSAQIASTSRQERPCTRHNSARTRTERLCTRRRAARTRRELVSSRRERRCSRHAERCTRPHELSTRRRELHMLADELHALRGVAPCAHRACLDASPPSFCTNQRGSDASPASWDASKSRLGVSKSTLCTSKRDLVASGAMFAPTEGASSAAPLAAEPKQSVDGQRRGLRCLRPVVGSREDEPSVGLAMPREPLRQRRDLRRNPIRHRASGRCRPSPRAQ
jgi:hypothetical protein